MRDVENTGWKFEILNEDAFSMTREDGFITVVFTPEKAGAQGLPIKPGIANSYAGTAPFGFQNESYRSHGILIEPTAYLRHDLSAQKKVWIDPRFPPKYTGSLLMALQKWNSTLGSELFQTRIQRKDFKQTECLANNVLCFVWNGAEDIPWSGLMALTTMSFDPDTGNIIGGVISINNFTSDSDLNPTPPAIIEEALGNDPGIQWIAQQYAREKEFVHYSHPFAAQHVEYFLLHEIGHFNGLEHNFAGTNRGDFNHPTDTIMDYLPFPVVFKANQLGAYDKAMLDLVYRGVTPPQSLRHCGASHLTGKNWAPNCDQRDLGNTLEWYNLLAHTNSDGLLMPISSLSPDFQFSSEPLASVVLRYFGTEMESEAKEVICQNMSAQLSRFLNEKKIELICEKRN